MKNKYEIILFVIAIVFAISIQLLIAKVFTLKVEPKIEERKPIEIKITGEFEYPKDAPIETYTTRLTSFYTGDSCNTGSITASGKSTKDFKTNEKGWYTYQGKLVVATASTRLGTTSMKTYNLYDEITLIIDGTEYQAIVLDVCGSCMVHNRIDLFVSGRNSVIDRNIEVIK